jgi:hypothetical protein
MIHCLSLTLSLRHNRILLLNPSVCRIHQRRFTYRSSGGEQNRIPMERLLRRRLGRDLITTSGTRSMVRRDVEATAGLPTAASRGLFYVVTNIPVLLIVVEYKTYAECSDQSGSSALEDQKVPPNLFHFL